MSEEAATSTLVVHEIYASIQGESTFAGIPCTFVRLTGCNLRCSWCDTEHAFYGGTRMSLDDVRDKALSFDTPMVELTGGEPLLQAASLPLMTALCDAGKTVLIETSGERDIAHVDPRVHRIMDLKAPGSGESGRNRWGNLLFLTKRDEVKIVLTDRADYEWARDVIVRERLHERAGAVLLSVAFGKVSPQDVVAWMLEDRLPARFQLQMHKFIWPADARGV